MYVLTVISDESDLFKSSELQPGVLFLFMSENILSLPTVEWGIVITTSAT